MDFTVIGSAVNLTSRLEGLCRRMGLDVVVTAEFAVHLPNRVSSLGEHKIRGVKGKVEVFGMA
jgi:class 3 adenylate cyclase